ncbi:MAG: NAD(+) diphosphatase [Actinomycetota bacterium]
MFEPLVTAPDVSDTDGSGPPGPWFCIDERSNVFVVDGEIPVANSCPLPTSDVHLLGRGPDGPVRAARVDTTAALPDDGALVHLRQLYGSLPDDEWVMAGRATQVLAWARDHRYCGRCGTETRASGSDRARICPSCGLMSYPRLAPAVIVLVERDDGYVLLAWGRQFPGRFYSALAGFVEPGESLEECVVREVREEVGVEIGDVRYFGSQPWPFPHSLMIGFTARYLSGDLVLQESEIVEADWYPHDALPPAPRGGMSIAGWLIEDWIARRAAAAAAAP